MEVKWKKKQALKVKTDYEKLSAFLLADAACWAFLCVVAFLKWHGLLNDRPRGKLDLLRGLDAMDQSPSALDGSFGLTAFLALSTPATGNVNASNNPSCTSTEA